MRTLKSIQAEIAHLQEQYRAAAARNRGVIRGAEDTAAIGDRIITSMNEYNARAKRTMYSGGRVVRRVAA